MIWKLIKYWFSLGYWQRQPVKKVNEMQLRKFKEVFEFARANSKFYHDLYEKTGVLDLDIQTWEDVKKVPIITKQMLRKASLEDIMTCPLSSKHVIHHTSGSSGNPFTVVSEKVVDYTSHMRVVWALMRLGYTPFKTITMVYRYDDKTKFEVEKDLKGLSGLRKLIPLLRHNQISIYEEPATIIAKLKEQKPYVLWSTPSLLFIIAKELEKNEDRLHIPILFLTSETHTDEYIRLFKERLADNFIDDYGCMEAPSMGFGYNRSDNKQLIRNFIAIEEINNRNTDDKGKIADVVISNLLNKAMPIIRYDIGDYISTDANTPPPAKGVLSWGMSMVA